MAAPHGPHTRNAKPGAVYRGSKNRIASFSPFEDLPREFWLFIAVGLLMLGISAALIYAEL